MSDGSSRLLTLKASRTQVAAKLAEWDAAYVREHGAEPTDAQRRHDARWRELHRLLADLDKHIRGVEGGGAKPELSSPAEERRSERGRIKARMRRWDRDFERLRGRKPTSADRRADAEFAELRERLSALSSGSSSTAPAPPGGAESTAAATGAQVEAVGWATLAGPSREASPLPVLPPSSPPPIAKGGHYNERVPRAIPSPPRLAALARTRREPNSHLPRYLPISTRRACLTGSAPPSLASSLRPPRCLRR